MICNKINAYLSSKDPKAIDPKIVYEIEKLSGVSFTRQFLTNDVETTAGKLRPSSAGRCPRQQAYAYHGFEKKGKEIDSRAKLIFWAGDLTEMTLLSLAKAAGCCVFATGFNQIRLPVKFNGTEITGHPDGLLLHEGEIYLIEVKSMSSYGFEKFERGEIDESYLAQVNLYLDALALDKCVFLAQNKDSGVINERILTRDPEIVAKAKANLMTVINSTKEKLPPPPPEYGPDTKGYYYWTCRFCAWFQVCRPNAELVLVKNSYILAEKKDS